MNRTKVRITLDKRVNKYLNFVSNALIGYLNASDIILEENYSAISHVAKQLYKKYPQKKTLFRGVLLYQSQLKHNGLLEPQDNMRYLSFSESRNKALDFAYPYPEYKKTFAQIKKPKEGEELEGYLIMYEPAPDDILYHWKWGIQMNLERLIEQNVKNVDMNIVRKHMKQDEVIVKDRKKLFRPQKVDWSVEKREIVAPRGKLDL